MRPIIVLPGYYGSNLAFADDLDSPIWLNGRSFISPVETLAALELDPDDPDRVVPVSVLDEVQIVPPFVDPDIYKRLALFLAEENPETEVHWFAYDWRKSMEEEAERLRATLEACCDRNNSDDVDLIAHSFGGLVARAYLELHGPEKVARLVSIGVPHKGMLKTFEAVDRGVRVLGVFPPAAVRSAARTAPSAFELLPNDPADPLFRWQGQQVAPLEDLRWIEAAVGDDEEKEHLRRMCSTAADSVSSLLPDRLPVETHILYGTRLETSTFAEETDGRLSFEDRDDGDSTVPRISAMGAGLRGSQGIQMRRYPIPFGNHMLLFDDPMAKTILRQIFQNTPPQPLLHVRFCQERLVLPGKLNSLAVELRDSAGEPIDSGEVRLTIHDTSVENRSIPQSASRGDFFARLFMPRVSRRLRYEVTAEAPTLPATLLHEGELRIL